MQRDESSPQEMRQERIYRALMQNLHPLAWRNPPPVDMYNLVVLGAGRRQLRRRNGRQSGDRRAQCPWRK
jgi:hypothetical protein